MAVCHLEKNSVLANLLFIIHPGWCPLCSEASTDKGVLLKTHFLSILWAASVLCSTLRASYGILLPLWDKRQQLSNEGLNPTCLNNLQTCGRTRTPNTSLTQRRCAVVLLSLLLEVCVLCWCPSCWASLSRSLALPFVAPFAYMTSTYWQRCKHIIYKIQVHFYLQSKFGHSFLLNVFFFIYTIVYIVD